MTRYVIIGAGAVGAGIGARLFQTGREVMLIARGAHLAALQADGLRLRTPEEDVLLAVPAVAGPDDIELRPDDVLILATKTQQAQDALISWADVPVVGGGTAGERLPLLTALNGVVGEDLALRYFRRVFGVCVWMWTAHLEPGEVIVEGSPLSGVYHVSRVPAASTDDHDRELLTMIKSDWDAATLRFVISDDVMPWKYRKLLTNIGNGFQALVGKQPGLGRLIKTAVAEGSGVLEHAGIEVISEAEEAVARTEYTVLPIPGLPDFIGGSTWQSLTRGTGNVETDYLNGELVRIARLHGREAPINAAIASLVRRAAASGAKPGELDVDELAIELGLDPSTGSGHD